MQLNQKLAIRYIRARINILALVSPRKAAVKAFDIFCTPRERAIKKGAAFFEKGTVLSFRQDGHTIRGHRWLPVRQPTKKVLIAHGYQSASRSFEAYVEALVKKGYEVVAFDAPAHGRSGGRRILLPRYVQMLQTIEQNYGPFNSYLGHSLGALALALFMEDTPVRAGAHVALVAPAVEISRSVEVLAETLHLTPEVMKEMDLYVKELGGHPFSWYSLRRALPAIKGQVLYVQDEDDTITPYSDALLVKKDGNTHVHFIFTKGLGHRKIYKDPEIMEKIVDFL